MPELPEVETTKLSLQPLLGKKVDHISIYQPKLRWQIPSNLNDLNNYVLQNIRRRAKYLLLDFAKVDDIGNEETSRVLNVHSKANSLLPSKTLIIHLGMSGSLQQMPSGSDKRKHDHVVFNFNSPNSPSTHIDEPLTAQTLYQLHYHDPRRFGAILWFDDYADKLFNHLGTEPLESNFNGEYLFNQIHKIDLPNTLKSSKRLLPTTRPIKSVIMDQTYVVGVGNIYATESLFLAGIHPNTPANLLTKQQLQTLSSHIVDILYKAIEQGGSTLKDFTVGGGTTGYFQQTLNVYGKHKQPCPQCNEPIEKAIISGRASTYCPVCQPLAIG